MFYEFFVLGSLSFALLLSAEFFFLFWCVSYRQGTKAVVSLFLAAAALQFFGNVPVFSWCFANPINFTELLGIYFLGAVVWVFVKWWLFIRDNSCRYDEILKQFIEKRNLQKSAKEFTLEEKVDWKEYFEENSHRDEEYEYAKIEFDPSPTKHKMDIMTWMMFWPWSLAWTLLNDPIRKIFKHIYYWITGWLENIRNVYWADKRCHMPTDAEVNQVSSDRYKAEMTHRREEDRKKSK